MDAGWDIDIHLARIEPNRVSSDDFESGAGRDAQILDAYVYGNWDVAERPVTARLGRQVPPDLVHRPFRRFGVPVRG